MTFRKKYKNVWLYCWIFFPFLKQFSIRVKPNNTQKAIMKKKQYSNQMPVSVYSWPKGGKQKTEKTPQIPTYLSSDSHPFSILMGKIVTHQSTKFIKGEPKPILSVIFYSHFSYDKSSLRNLILVICYTWLRIRRPMFRSQPHPLLQKKTSVIYQKETKLGREHSIQW